jgi:3-oxoacyl-[acyl-carrier protein] reductase
MSIIDRVVLVSGASKGIGKAIALQAGKEGAFVIVNYNSDAQGADKVVVEIGASRALAVQADISKAADIDRLIEASVTRFGKIDVVVPNAAYVPLADVEAAKEDHFDMAFGVNVKGPWLLVQVCLRLDAPLRIQPRR